METALRTGGCSARDLSLPTSACEKPCAAWFRRPSGQAIPQWPAHGLRPRVLQWYDIRHQLLYSRPSADGSAGATQAADPHAMRAWCMVITTTTGDRFMPFLRAAVCVLAAFSASFALPALAQENWPTKPLKLIIPFPAGGSSDQLGRLMAKELGQKLGQPVQVENTDAKGTKAAAGAAPDGYTLVLSGVGTNAIGHALNPNLGYDSLKDFVHISQLSEGPNVLVVPAASPLKSLQDLIETGKAHPGKLT